MAVIIDYQDVLGRLYDKSYSGRITPKQTKMLEKLVSWDNQLENLIDYTDDEESYNDDIHRLDTLQEFMKYIKDNNIKGDIQFE